MGLEIKQRPMDDLGLCALGPILMPTIQMDAASANPSPIKTYYMY
jgi:hypothetical protein